jgi:hypothetical protein
MNSGSIADRCWLWSPVPAPKGLASVASSRSRASFPQSCDPPLTGPRDPIPEGQKVGPSRAAPGCWMRDGGICRGLAARSPARGGHDLDPANPLVGCFPFRRSRGPSERSGFGIRTRLIPSAESMLRGAATKGRKAQQKRPDGNRASLSEYSERVRRSTNSAQASRCGLSPKTTRLASTDRAQARDRTRSPVVNQLERAN